MVADALAAALRLHHPLARLARPPEQVPSATSTWVWFVELAGTNLPVAWQVPLVVRIFRPDESSVAEREDRLSTFLTALDYPAPATVLRGQLGNPAHPFVLQVRLPGRSAAELLATPHLPTLLRALGALQGQLHQLSTANFPLRRMTATVYIEHDLGKHRERTTAVDPDDWMSWLRSTALRHEATDESDIVVCHGDFHPLNAVVDAERDLQIGIVDWTDACLADRHLDVGRSVAIYFFASVIARSRLERGALRLLRNWMARTHLRAYRRATGVELDERRLVWWQIVHLYRGWLQLSGRAEGAVAGPPSTTAQRLTPKLRDELLERCHELRASLDR